MIEFQCDRAQSYYERAKENLTEEDRSRLVAAEVMRSIYYAIFIKIKKNPFRILDARVTLSQLEYFWRLLVGWMHARL